MVKSNTKKIACLGMLAALSYLLMVIGRVPLISAVPFLKYDPKDIIIAIAGFIYGPLSSFIISIIVSFIEMFTVSDTGYWGLFMNILSTCSFACTAAIIYKKIHSIRGAVIGLVTGALLMTGLMLLWNYFITPIYMGQSREAVAAMLLPVFLPFNLIKGGLNAALTMLIYKPVVSTLRKAQLIPPSQKQTKSEHVFGYIFLSALILISCIVLVVIL